MSSVSDEVYTHAARFNVAVRAESTRRAVDLVKAYYPGADVRLVPPYKSALYRVARTVSVRT